MRAFPTLWMIAFFVASSTSLLAESSLSDMVLIPTGVYTPLYKNAAGEARIQVEAFYLDRYAVTNAQFLEFVKAYPQWRGSQVKRIFADASYLQHWHSDLTPNYQGYQAESPVTQVSWFAAMAYCRSQGKRLPNLDEWEYAAAAGVTTPQSKEDPQFKQWILDWYSAPTPQTLSKVGSTFHNYWGVSDLHGLIWEWVADFNTALVTGESRGDSGLERDLFCGSGSIRSSDFQDYAAFLRYGLRGSLKANYTNANLGFRCAQDR